MLLKIGELLKTQLVNPDSDDKEVPIEDDDTSQKVCLDLLDNLLDAHNGEPVINAITKAISRSRD